MKDLFTLSSMRVDDSESPEHAKMDCASSSDPLPILDTGELSRAVSSLASMIGNTVANARGPFTDSSIMREAVM